jgi:hypothetical protein
MSVRKIALVAAVACAAALAAPVAAGAATSPAHATSFSRIPVTGKASNGKAFNGRYTIDRFATRHGKTVAIGTLTGRLGHRLIRQTDFAMPVAVEHAAVPGLARSAVTCPILHLDLGPLNLNLLGLKIHLNEVVLDITAQSGPGNLLGNLLCSVANLLNGPSLLGQQISGLLNIVQNLLGTPGLLNL